MFLWNNVHVMFFWNKDSHRRPRSAYAATCRRRLHVLKHKSRLTISVVSRHNMSQPKPHVYTFRLPLPSVRHASIAAAALNADDELRPELVSREIDTDGASLTLRLAAVDARVLRISVMSFFDFALVALRTLEEFGES